MRLAVATCLVLFFGLLTIAQDTPADADGHIVDFSRDVAPIFKQRCLECHGEEEPKGDFRIDQSESVLDYVEGGDVESSSLYMDYLINHDEDMMMPPPKHGGPLKAQELALIQVWIQEGAAWPEDFQFTETSELDAAAPAPPAETPSLFSRVWDAQGFLHPATVHFPIALFLLGAGFVVLGWKWPAIGTQIPLACLIIGALTSIAATLMGWSFAVERGYGGWNRFDAPMWEKEVFWHRWSAVILTVLSVFFAILALLAIKKDSKKLRFSWKLGLLICAAISGAVGHQGGEMSYGKDFYPKMFRTLFGQPAQPISPEPDSAESDSQQPDSQQPTGEQT